MSQKQYVYATFNNTLDAMAAEKLFKEQAIPGRLVIIPRELSAGCGMAWRSQPDQKQRLVQVAQDHDLDLKQVAII